MLEIRHLEKYYAKGSGQEIHAVRDTSLALPETGIVALFGASGCGKTTLLNLIGGLDRADGGEVVLNGERITPDATEVRNRQIGYIFQNYQLLPNETVYENVALSLRLAGVQDEGEIKTRTMAALDAVEMAAYSSRVPGTLSGGQQQRVAIARALVKNPHLILADEPTGNLDEQNTVMVMDLLRQVAQDHLVLLVTHEQDLLPYYCDLIVEISDGAVLDVRENSTGEGYRGQSKTEVYLGNMPVQEGQVGEIAVSYYGDAALAPQSLRLIAHGGMIYLSAPDGVRLRVLDSSAEIRVHEGQYLPEERKAVKELDPILLTSPHSTGKVGRMWHFATAFASGFRTHFGRVKRGKRLLISSLCLFSIAFVMMISYFGTAIRTLREARYTYNTDTLYVAMSALGDEQLSALLASPLVDSVTPETAYAYDGEITLGTTFRTYWSFTLGGFESGNIGKTTVSSPIQLLNQTAAAGEKQLVSAPLAHYEDLRDDEILISSGLADLILQSTGVSYLTDYEDLLYLQGSTGSSYVVYDTIDSQYGSSFANLQFTVVGVVEDPNPAVYATDVTLIRCMLNESNLGIGFLDEETCRALGIAAPAAGTVYTTVGTGGEGTEVTAKLLGQSYTVDDTLLRLSTGEELSWEVSEALGSLTDTYYMCREDYTGLMERASQIATPYSEELYSYFALHSQDVKALAGLCGELGLAGDLLLPETLYKEARAQSTGGLVTILIVAVVFLFLMVLCMTLVMRSGMMASVKQVGTLRAIGVSRVNLLFRYFCESLMVFAVAVFPGYLFASASLFWISAKTRLLESVFYYPIWLAALTLLFLAAVTAVCGTLPVRSLTKKTPAQILAKYDI